MNLNLLLVIMAVVLICMVMDGYKKGMVKSLISLISLLITCVVLFLIGNGLSSTAWMCTILRQQRWAATILMWIIRIFSSGMMTW